MCLYTLLAIIIELFTFWQYLLYGRLERNWVTLCLILCCHTLSDTLLAFRSFLSHNEKILQDNSTTGDGRVDEQLELLSERITGLVSEAERLGSEGNVEEAQGLLKLCDQLREERDTLRRSSENSVWHQVIF